jgi:hypothetical protein
LPAALPAHSTLPAAGLAIFVALLSIPVQAGWLIGGRGGFAVLLLTTTLLLWTSWRLVSTLSNDHRWDVRALDTATLTLAFVAVSGLVLGTVGLLYLPALVLFLAVSSLVILWWTNRRSSIDASIDGPNWSLANVRWPHALLAGLVMFGIGQLARDRGTLPPVGDAIGYHLPFVGEWLQHGRLVMPVPAAGDPSPPFYPVNSSLWTFWTLAPFEGDVVARFIQSPFYLLLGLAVVRLALEIRVPPVAALTAGLLTLSLPDVIRGLTMPENDVILAALLVMATASLAMLWNRPSVWRAGTVAALLGMAIGTKVLALPFVAVLGLVWLVIVIYHWRPTGWNRIVRIALLGAAIVVVLGSYSYIRNWVVMDNPSYPVRTEFRGEEIFPGLYTATREWRETHPFYSFDWPGFFGFGMRGFFGWMVPLFILPGMVLAAIRVVRERYLRPMALALWCAMSLAIFWFVIPYHFERFLYGTLTWGIVVAVWGWLMLLRGRERWLAVAVIPLTLVNVSSLPLDTGVWRNPAYIAGAGIIVGITAGVFLAARHARHLVTPAIARVAIVALLVLSVVAFPVYADRYEAQRFDQYGRLRSFLGSQPETWRWLWEETRDDPVAIAVAGTNATWLLYGPTLENRVLTISRDGHLQSYDWGTPFTPFGEPDRERWMETLGEAGVDYLWITPNVSFGGWPDEDVWAAEAGFEPVVYDDDLHVWRVIP